jgi:hypothetical protein
VIFYPYCPDPNSGTTPQIYPVLYPVGAPVHGNACAQCAASKRASQGYGRNLETALAPLNSQSNEYFKHLLQNANLEAVYPPQQRARAMRALETAMQSIKDGSFNKKIVPNT